MDTTDYFVLLLAKEKMAEAQAWAAEERLLRSAQAPRRPVRVHLGMALIRCGHWFLRKTPEFPGGSERPA